MGRLHTFGIPSHLTSNQVRAFVGPNADYYLERWLLIEEEQLRPLGFNWPAFFLTGSWLLYRRMYRWFCLGFAVHAGVVALQIAAAVANLRYVVVFIGIALGLSRFAIPIVLGKYGTYWYYLHARRVVRRIAPEGRREDLPAIARAGGVDWVTATLVSVALAALFVWSKSQSD
jgi:hypothetical protein